MKVCIFITLGENGDQDQEGHATTTTTTTTTGTTTSKAAEIVRLLIGVYRGFNLVVRQLVVGSGSSIESIKMNVTNMTTTSTSKEHVQQ